jgi:hypothetical protein
MERDSERIGREWQKGQPGCQSVGNGPGRAAWAVIQCVAPPLHFDADKPVTQRSDFDAGFDLSPEGFSVFF